MWHDAPLSQITGRSPICQASEFLPLLPGSSKHSPGASQTKASCSSALRPPSLSLPLASASQAKAVTTLAYIYVFRRKRHTPVRGIEPLCVHRHRATLAINVRRRRVNLSVAVFVPSLLSSFSTPFLPLHRPPRPPLPRPPRILAPRGVLRFPVFPELPASAIKSWPASVRQPPLFRRRWRLSYHVQIISRTWSRCSRCPVLHVRFSPLYSESGKLDRNWRRA